MKVYLCADCGQELEVKYSGIPGNRKARIVSSHECSGEKDEFVRNLNDLPPGKVEALPDVGDSTAPVGTPFEGDKAEAGVTLHDPMEKPTELVDPGDRRDTEHVKSTAPPGIGQTLGLPDAPDNLPEEDEAGRGEPTAFPAGDGSEE